MMHSPRRVAKISVVASCFVFTLVLYFSGIALPQPWRFVIIIFPAAAGTALWLFDSWIWKTELAQRFIDRPVIDGTWYGTITPTNSGRIPEDDRLKRNYPVGVIVTQSFWSIAVRTVTSESTSQSTAADLAAVPGQARQSVLTYAYVNTPALKHQEVSRAHRGAASIPVSQSRPKVLRGEYWTDRHTSGEIEVHWVDEKKDFASLSDIEVRHPRKRGAKAVDPDS